MTRIERMIQLIAALTLMTVLLTSCGTGSQSSVDLAAADDASAAAFGGHPDHASAVGGGHAGHAETPASNASSFSLYDLEAVWQDQGGRSLTLDDLAGRPRVIAMVYTSCAYACPRILKDMKRIEGELRAAGSDAGYVLVSIDPLRDSPDRLREYATSVMLDPADWTLLTGTEDGVLELAALLGVRYRRVSDTDFEHSNIITLLDGEGRIVHRQLGLEAEPDALIRAAVAL